MKNNELPEIVVKPSKESNEAVKRSKTMFPVKSIRSQIQKDYNTWGIDELGVSETDALNRLYTLWNKAGNPTMSTSKSIFMGNREHYDPIKNKIYTPDPTFDGYVAELAHAYLFNSPKYSPYKKVLQNPLENLKNLFKRNSKTYNRKGSLEHEAHKIIEPKLWDFIVYGK